MISFLGLGSLITISANNASLQTANVEARDKSKYVNNNLSRKELQSKIVTKADYSEINNHLISVKTINNAKEIYQYLLNNNYLHFSKASALALVYISYSDTYCSANAKRGFINWNTKYQEQFEKQYKKSQRSDLHNQLDFFMKNIICKHSAKEQSKLTDEESINSSINYIYNDIFHNPRFAHKINEKRLQDVETMIKD